jgi:hypothetical protein
MPNEAASRSGFEAALDPATRRAMLDLRTKIEQLEVIITALEQRVYDLENP